MALRDTRKLSPSPVSVFYRSRLKIFVGPFRVAYSHVTLIDLRSFDEVEKCFLRPKGCRHLVISCEVEFAHVVLARMANFL
jgi:hypothetical protein